eukprot:PhM_4_TR18047/c0_g1_i1/m.97366
MSMLYALEDIIPSSLMNKIRRVFFIALSHGRAIETERLPHDLFVALCVESALLDSPGVTNAYIRLVWNSYTERTGSMDIHTFIPAIVNLAVRACSDAAELKVRSHTTSSQQHRSGVTNSNNNSNSNKERGRFEVSKLELLFVRYLDAYTSRYVLTVANGITVDPMRNGWPPHTNQVIMHATHANIDLLMDIFREFSGTPDGRRGVMTRERFIDVAGALDVSPRFVDEASVRMIFEKANTHDTYKTYYSNMGRSPDDGGMFLRPELEFDEFCDALLLLALKCFSGIEYTQKYQTMQSRAVLFFHHIVKVHNSRRAKEEGQQVKKFCYVPLGESDSGEDVVYDIAPNVVAIPTL